MLTLAFFGVLLCAIGFSASVPSNSSKSWSQTRLAVQPKCGNLNSGTFVNFNSGIDLQKIKTFYTFGDSWTTNGKRDGSPAKPAVCDDTSPRCEGRVSNGMVWSEYLTPPGATLRNYAIAGSTVDRKLWSARATGPDMVGHVDMFLGQHQAIEASSTLTALLYGFNDYGASSRGPGTMDQAASQLLVQVKRLIKAGMRNFLVISLTIDRPKVNHYSDLIWQGLKELKKKEGIEFSYVDLRPLFTAMLANPKSFGYKSSGTCLQSGLTTVGRCENPNDMVYWCKDHPSSSTHHLMADWMRQVVTKCNSRTETGKLFA